MVWSRDLHNTRRFQCNCVFILKLELVYLPKGKYCVYPRMVYRLAIVTPPPILDAQKSLSIAFLAISDQYATFIFAYNMAAGGQFRWPKITLDTISRHFRSIRNFDFFSHKMAASGHFGWTKITFKRISHHFRSIRNFDFFSTKWLPAAILDDRK